MKINKLLLVTLIGLSSQSYAGQDTRSIQEFISNYNSEIINKKHNGKTIIPEFNKIIGHGIDIDTESYLTESCFKKSRTYLAPLGSNHGSESKGEKRVIAEYIKVKSTTPKALEILKDDIKAKLLANMGEPIHSGNENYYSLSNLEFNSGSYGKKLENIMPKINESIIDDLLDLNDLNLEPNQGIVVITLRKTNEAHSLSMKRNLDNSAITALSNSNDDFINQCGSKVIQQINLGNTAFALIKINRQLKTKLGNRVTANIKARLRSNTGSSLLKRQAMKIPVEYKIRTLDGKKIDAIDEDKTLRQVMDELIKLKMDSDSKYINSIQLHYYGEHLASASKRRIPAIGNDTSETGLSRLQEVGKHLAEIKRENKN